MSKILMNQEKCAKFLGVNAETLRRWAAKNAGPPRILIGKRYYYRRDMLKTWLDSRRVVAIDRPLKCAASDDEIPVPGQP